VFLVVWVQFFAHTLERHDSLILHFGDNLSIKVHLFVALEVSSQVIERKLITLFELPESGTISLNCCIGQMHELIVQVLGRVIS
jgi:hypothetical protein